MELRRKEKRQVKEVRRHKLVIRKNPMKDKQRSLGNDGKEDKLKKEGGKGGSAYSVIGYCLLALSLSLVMKSFFPRPCANHILQSNFLCSKIENKSIHLLHWLIYCGELN